MNLTVTRMKKLIKIYKSFNLYDLEYFLSLCADRITVPVHKGDSVDCQQGTFAKLNGIYIDIITEEFEDSLEKDKENLRKAIKEQKDKEADNLLNDKNE